MQIRASLLTVARAAAIAGVISAAGACTHPSAHLMVDAPKAMTLPYQPPDIDEITGIDSDDTAAAPAPAQTPHK
jgi:hypothetical protein